MDEQHAHLRALISPELLEEYKRLYEEEFGDRLSDEEAFTSALFFLRLMRAIYRPIPAHKRALYKSLERCYDHHRSEKP